MSKLEPHVLGGPPPDDVDLFLADLNDEARFIKGASEVTEEPIESSVNSDEQEAKEGFVRLADFLKRKLTKSTLHKHPRSKRALALEAYRVQKSLFSNETDENANVIDVVSHIDKGA